MKRSKANALMVLYAGEKMYRIAMPFVFILLGAIALLGLLCLGFVVTGDGDYLPGYFAFNGHYPFLSAIFSFDLILIGLGFLALPFFLFGLLLIGVGQIALNTLHEDKNQELAEEDSYEPYYEGMFGIDIPGLVSEEAPAVPLEPAEAPAPVPAPTPAPQPTQPAPESKPAPQPAPQQEKPQFSPMLINGLRQAVESKTDDEMFAILEKAAAKTRVPHEKQLIRQIMNRSTSKIRPMVQEVYTALTEQ